MYEKHERSVRKAVELNKAISEQEAIAECEGYHVSRYRQKAILESSHVSQCVALFVPPTLSY